MKGFKESDIITIKTHVPEKSVDNDCTTLKIKAAQGTKFIIKLKFDDTIKTLRQYLNQHLQYILYVDLPDRFFRGSTDYELSSFPSKKYEFENQTLRSAGLIPNATLFITYKSKNNFLK
jgi:hypothetical protein